MNDWLETCAGFEWQQQQALPQSHYMDHNESQEILLCILFKLSTSSETMGYRWADLTVRKNNFGNL
jgi:hypothetical protein